MAEITVVAKHYWKRFLWMWLFPLAFLASLLIPTFPEHPRSFFFAIDLPVFFACYYFASKPVRDGKVTKGQGMILIVLLPFVLWASLIFALFGLVILTGAGHR